MLSVQMVRNMIGLSRHTCYSVEETVRGRAPVGRPDGPARDENLPYYLL